jgi:aminomethyltransferase
MTVTQHKADLKRTPFHSFHLEHHAKMVPFAGYELPLHYGSLLEEHQAVRTGGGIFDVSHMGRIRFSGRHARRFLESICTRRLSDMQAGQCRYSLICNERGGVRDDVIVYRFDGHWLMVCNAANREKLLGHFEDRRGDLAVKIEDQTDSTAMIALQGPKVMELIGQFSREVPTLKRYHFAVKNLLILKLTISRTGYTGEDGVEVILPAGMIGMALKLFLGKSGDAVRPCGLGCRDTLRTEAGMPLYGHELSEEIDPLSAGLAFAVSLDKGQEEEGTRFIGQDALEQIAAHGPSRKLVGLKLEGRRSPRPHMPVKAADTVVGEVTSGCLSPTLGHPIAMAYVEASHAAEGTRLRVDFGGEPAAGEVVKPPFYRRS